MDPAILTPLFALLGTLVGGLVTFAVNRQQFKHQLEMLHQQYKTEYENGISVAWHRVPFTLGCAGNWSEAARISCSVTGGAKLKRVLMLRHMSDTSIHRKSAVSAR